MTIFNKIISVFLCTLMLLFVLISCDARNLPSKDGGADVSGTETETGATSESMKGTDNDGTKCPPPGILEGNYKAFNISMEEGEDHVGNFLATEITGDLANDTLYHWITKIETAYNVDVTVVANHGTDLAYANAIKMELASGNTQYHLYGIRANQSWQVTVENLFLDWNSLSKDWIDLSDEDRWDVACNEAMSFNGKFYTASGDLGVSKLKNTMATFYKVDLLERFCSDNGYDQEYLYGLVEDGDWTLEAMEEIVKDVYSDENRNGIRDINDIYGYYSHSNHSYDMWVPAMGITPFSKDEGGKPIAVMNTPENMAKLQKVKDFYTKNRGVMNSSEELVTATNQFGISEGEMLANGKAMFITTTFASLNRDFSNMGNHEYGILPQPKYDDDQNHYVSYVKDECDVWGINGNFADGDDRDFAAHVTDALCLESSNSVYYQYYDILLKQKFSKDRATAKMVDLIMENIMCDASRQYAGYLKTVSGVDGYADILRAYLCESDYDLETALEEYETVLKNPGGALERMFDAYENRWQ